MEVVFFCVCLKKIESSGDPIGLLTRKKFFYHIVNITTDRPLTSLQQFLMTSLSARSNLLNFSPKKNSDFKSLQTHINFEKHETLA